MHTVVNYCLLQRSHLEVPSKALQQILMVDSISGVRANLSDTIRVFFVGYESAIVDVKTGNQDKKLVIRLEPQRNYLPDVLIEAEGIKSIESSSEPGLYLLNPGQMTSTSGTGEFLIS